MKARLEFTLPEEKEEFSSALNGNEYLCVLIDIDNLCRSGLKHGHTYENIEEVLELIREMMPELYG